MRRTSADDACAEELCRRLAEVGVPIFDAPPESIGDADVAALARIVLDLMESPDGSLAASIPCVIAVHAEHACQIVATAATIRPDAVKSLGFLYRLARCLTTSRGPDIRALFGRQRVPRALDIEPDDPRAPEISFGEAGIADASDADPVLVGDAVALFDWWIRGLWSWQVGPARSAAAARLRAMLDEVFRS